MRAICKVHGLTLLLWVRTLWRWIHSLFFEVPPSASDALLMTLHPFLENMLQTIDHFKISCLGAPFSWLEKSRNCMGQDLDCIADVLTRLHWSTFSKPNIEFNSDLAPCNFWAFPMMKRELQGKKFWSDRQSAACFEKWVEHCKKCTACQGRYFQKKKKDHHHTSTKFQLGVIMWVHKLCKWTSYMDDTNSARC
jgi:hypothetical protein